MEKIIDPSKLTVESCLRGKKYFIDFYQREYVWSKPTLETLLRDICWPFENAYKQYGSSDLTQEVLSKYPWYYLNVFITNDVGSKIYIVDGQQRLSSLTLIAAYLHRVVEDENIKAVLKDCVYSADRFAGNIYCLDHDKRKRIMDCIFQKDGTGLEGGFKNVTEETLFNRYQDIKAFFATKNYSPKELYVFANYFLSRLVLVELAIDKNNTPMVFEVINDRGEALKPFEILKGKLIGALSKEDTEHYSAVWDDAMVQIKGMEDDFFVDFLKSRFLFTKNSKLITTITNTFHRYIFEADNHIANELKFRQQDLGHIENIKSFVEQDVKYYAGLYGRVRSSEYEYLVYDSKINSLVNQYQNILAACTPNDPDEQRKIESIAREYDRMFVLLRLNGVYNSNSFQEIAYELNKSLRGRPVETYRALFDQQMEAYIKERTGKLRLDSMLDYEKFNQQDYSTMDVRSLRYLFARVEKYLCCKSNKEMQSSVYDIVRRSGAFHIEHILSRNAESESKFATVEDFEKNRNRLGGLLLLLGKNNQSSSNERYSEKLKTYSNGFEWGRTLIAATYHANKEFTEFCEQFRCQHGVGFEPIDDFDSVALDARCRLLYEIVKEIWEF